MNIKQYIASHPETNTILISNGYNVSLLAMIYSMF